MSERVYLVNERSGRKFRVIARNKDEGTITLKGEFAEFTEKFDATRFKALGYKVEKVEEDEEELEDA